VAAVFSNASRFIQANIKTSPLSFSWAITGTSPLSSKRTCSSQDSVATLTGEEDSDAGVEVDKSSFQFKKGEGHCNFSMQQGSWGLEKNNLPD
jgi:hypothetical protein